MSNQKKELLEMIHSLHGHAILAARDADSDDRRRELLAEAHAFEMVLGIMEGDWRPFDDNDLQPHYRQVSKGVFAADRQASEENNHDIGLQ